MQRAACSRADRQADDLRRAMRSPGCSICTLLAEAEEEALGQLLDAGRDPDERSQPLPAGGGLCARHAWRLDRLAAGSDAASTLYRELARRALDELETLAARLAREPERRRAGLVRRLAGVRQPAAQLSAARCPACAGREDHERRLVAALAGALGDDGFRHDLGRSDGLCLPHLRRVLARSDRTGVSVLADLHRRRLAALDRELQDYIRKCDWSHRHEPKGEEQTAWIRAIARFSGNQPR